MKKVLKRLTQEQINKGVVFSSTLSVCRTEQEGDTTHEVYKDTIDKELMIDRLLDDKFFNNSHFKYNIIRR